MAPRFFVSRPLQSGTTIELPDATTHHALRVLRLAEGAAMTLFDGTGGEYRATLARAGKRGAAARVGDFDPVDRESPVALALVQSLLATDAMDYAVRKSVELGVVAIAPVIATRSQRATSGDRIDRRLAHWRSIVIAACEQCGRNRIPALAAPQALDDWLRAPDPTPAAIAVAGADESLATHVMRTFPRAIVVGPEGGFTDAELALAKANGVAGVHLGRRVLRAETAAIAALAMLSAIAGDAR